MESYNLKNKRRKIYIYIKMFYCYIHDCMQKDQIEEIISLANHISVT